MVKKKTTKKPRKKRVPEIVARKPAMNHWEYRQTAKMRRGTIAVPAKLKRAARQLDKMGYNTKVWWDQQNRIWWLYKSRKKRK